MITDTSDARRERELAWCRARSPDTYITSPDIGIIRAGFGFEFGRHSTTPARESEQVEWIISGNGLRLRGNLLDHKWKIDPELTTVGTGPSAHESIVFNTAQDAQWLRTSLELSMADLASLFGVTRKAVYDWLDGTKTPKAAYIRAVRTLIEHNLPPECRPYLRQFWASSPNNMEPLFDIITSGDPTRLQESASTALAALANPLSDYTKQLTTKNQTDVTGYVHNDDIYRSL